MCRDTHEGVGRDHDAGGAEAALAPREERRLVGQDGRRLDDGDAPDGSAHVHLDRQLFWGEGVCVCACVFFMWVFF